MLNVGNPRGSPEAGPVLGQLDQLLPIGHRAEVIYSLLIKYTQQNHCSFYKEQQ